MILKLFEALFAIGCSVGIALSAILFCAWLWEDMKDDDR